jgi:hypothetical protein
MGSGLWASMFEDKSNLPLQILADLSRKAQRYLFQNLEMFDGKPCEMMFPQPDGTRICILEKFYGPEGKPPVCREGGYLCWMQGKEI